MWTGLLAPVQEGTAPGSRPRGQSAVPSWTRTASPCASLKRAGPGGLRLRHL